MAVPAPAERENEEVEDEEESDEDEDEEADEEADKEDEDGDGTCSIVVTKSIFTTCASGAFSSSQSTTLSRSEAWKGKKNEQKTSTTEE